MSTLSKKEEEKYNVIQKVVSREYTKQKAVEELGIGIRQINRLIIKFKNEGKEGFIHKTKGKESKRKISAELREEIVNLYITEYFDYNFTHFYEEIQEKYSISYKTLDNILTEADIISPEAQHKTVKL